MDTLLQTLLSWQFILFSLGIAAGMYVLRTIVEYMMNIWQVTAKESKLWNDLLLPVLPVIFGAITGIVFKSYPYPDALTTGGDRFMFGAVAGLLSTLLYRVIKSLLIQKMQTIASVIPDTNVTPSENTLDDSTLESQKQINK